ncbi:MAG: hypothetical protein AMXMBFR20_15670 [Planctomycetia bacterium]
MQEFVGIRRRGQKSTQKSQHIRTDVTVEQLKIPHPGIHSGLILQVSRRAGKVRSKFCIILGDWGYGGPSRMG